jgi:hypothetical protein
MRSHWNQLCNLKKYSLKFEEKILWYKTSNVNSFFESIQLLEASANNFNVEDYLNFAVNAQISMNALMQSFEIINSLFYSPIAFILICQNFQSFINTVEIIS